MKPVTRLMINDFKIKQLGFDFMGYDFKKVRDLSFHHLIVARRDCKAMGMGDGYSYENGAILVQETSHNYLHLIEHYDEEIFNLVTSEMIDEKIKGRIDPENLKRINDLLLYFEKEHCSTRNKKGKMLIREKYIRRVIS